MFIILLSKFSFIPFVHIKLYKKYIFQAPEAIAQVRLLVQELRRITLLWDELWLGTLTQHHTEISRRLSQLELEILRVDSNPSLTPTERENLVAEKHRIILKPVS